MSLMSGVLERKFIFEPGDVRVRTVESAAAAMGRRERLDILDIGLNLFAPTLTGNHRVLTLDGAGFGPHVGDMKSNRMWTARSMNWFLGRLNTVYSSTPEFMGYLRKAPTEKPLANVVFFAYQDSRLREIASALSLSHDFLKSDRYDKLLVFLDSVLETM